jgi:hypothetical protein
LIQSYESQPIGESHKHKPTPTTSVAGSGSTGPALCKPSELHIKPVVDNALQPNADALLKASHLREERKLKNVVTGCVLNMISDMLSMICVPTAWGSHLAADPCLSSQGSQVTKPRGVTPENHSYKKARSLRLRNYLVI